MKKIIIALSTLIILIGFAPKNVFAASTPSPSPAATGTTAASSTSTWFSENPIEWYLKVYDDNLSSPNEIFGERYTAAQVQWVMYSIPSVLMNLPGPAARQLWVCVFSKEIGNCGKELNNLIDLTNPLAQMPPKQSLLATVFPTTSKTLSEIKNRLVSTSIVPVVHAQGFGYTIAADPIKFLWTQTRNFSYGLLIVVILIMSFMIMFRIKISPQVVISVQSALPKIVGALILVTFSYAIAGFMIDLMYVLIGVFSTFILSAHMVTASTQWIDVYRGLTDSTNVVDILFKYWTLFVSGSAASIPTFQSGSGGGVLAILVTLFSVISILFILYYAYKIVVMLVKAYLQILILIVVAPFRFIFGLIFQGEGLGPWLKDLLANLLVFPITGIMFFFAYLFIMQPFPQSSLEWMGIPGGYFTGTSWSPPLTIFTTGGTSGQNALLYVLLSWTVVGAIPGVAEMVKGFVSGKTAGFRSAMGDAKGLAKNIGGGAGEVLRTGSVGKGFTGSALSALKWLTMIP